jgi:hypothetical protein
MRKGGESQRSMVNRKEEEVALPEALKDRGILPTS